MLKKRSFRVLITVLLVVIFSLSMSVSAFAASGAASITANQYATFYVNVTGNTSPTAHVNIYSMNFTSGQQVIIQVRKLNGETCLAGAESWLITSNGAMWFNFMNAMPGQYQVTVQPVLNQWFSIAVEILPGYH